MLEEKKAKVKKGSLAVHVGTDGHDLHKFVIPISYLYHASFKGLLERSRDMYGYHVTGPIRLPCSVDDFAHLRWTIEREGSAGGGGGHGDHRQFHQSLSFKSC